jgi:hypothetical protein
MELTTPSALQRIPLEIWTNIFLECLPNHRFVKADPLAAPLVLCSVCRVWGLWARSTPRLWTSIHLDVSLGKDFRKVVKGVAQWLTYSANLPLSISFTWDGTHRRVDTLPPRVMKTLPAPLEKLRYPEWMDPKLLLDIFFLAISRWESVKFSFQGHLVSSLLDFKGKQAPLLRRFELGTEVISANPLYTLSVVRKCDKRTPFILAINRIRRDA